MPTTASEHLDSLYPAHLAAVKSRFDEALSMTGYDAVVIGAGTEIMRFLDDQSYPFRTNPHLVQWLPLLGHPESVLLYRPGEKPRLLIYRPDDFWHAPPELPGEPWASHFELTTTGRLSGIDQALKRLRGRIAFIGDPVQWRHEPPAADCNPASLLNYLHYYRPLRTGYEIECIRLAGERAVPGHRAAKRAFFEGDSEHEILLAFLEACSFTENELPYPAIVAKNEHGSVLHYQRYDTNRGLHDSLLIDAGCACNGYACDITRTYGDRHADGADEFLELVDEFDELQRQLVALVAPGESFAGLHAKAHAAIASLLQASGIVSTATEPVETGITAAFFPHGLGHFLGLQVHEAGGLLADPQGTKIEPPGCYPNLRLLRTLEAGQILTIEPGLYFIDTLLSELQNHPAGHTIDWKKITRLRKFGGIRIEDNVLVTADGQENLTRRAFDSN